MIRRTLTALGAGAIAAIALVSLMAATGGFPSRPIFQTVRMGNDGTAAAPAIARLSDTTTGVFFNDGAISDEVAIASNGFKTFGAHSTGATANGRAFLYSPRTDDLGGITLEFRENDTTTVKGALGFSDSGTTDVFTLQNLENHVDAGVDVRAETGWISLTAGSGLGTFQALFMDAAADKVSIETEALVQSRGGAEFRVPSHQFKRKTADTSRVNTTTFASDPHLIADNSLAIGSTYTWELYLVVDAATADPDIKLQLVCTNAAGAFSMSASEATVGALTGTAHNGVTLGGMPTFNSVALTGTNDHHIRILGSFTPVQVCTPALHWAQQTLDAADAVTIYTHSWMLVTQVN